jgi:hypothetical protein
MIPGLAEAVDADERIKRRAELFELGDLTKTEYLARKNDLRIERDQLEAQPAAASIALQRQAAAVCCRRLVDHDRGENQRNFGQTPNPSWMESRESDDLESQSRRNASPMNDSSAAR